VNNESFSSICEDVFKIVSPQIKYKKMGVLYDVLNILLEGKEEEFHAKDLCHYFGINKDSYLEKDQEFAENFLNDITKLVYTDRLVGSKKLNKNLSTTSIGISNFFNEKFNHSKEDIQMEWIVVVACLIVGTFACYKYLQRTRSTNIISPTASLCLAVPASAVYNLQEGSSLRRDEVVRLIDSATEFLCVPESKNIPVEIVEIIDEERSSESRLKFYIRINLTNGGNIIGKETQYGMTRELPLNVTGKVIEIGFLKNVSILRKFNRI
jgi:hypothetical protein